MCYLTLLILQKNQNYDQMNALDQLSPITHPVLRLFLMKFIIYFHLHNLLKRFAITELLKRLTKLRHTITLLQKSEANCYS